MKNIAGLLLLIALVAIYFINGFYPRETAQAPVAPIQQSAPSENMPGDITTLDVVETVSQ